VYYEPDCEPDSFDYEPISLEDAKNGKGNVYNILITDLFSSEPESFTRFRDSKVCYSTKIQKKIMVI
jgi:hypothetical protein